MNFVNNEINKVKHINNEIMKFNFVISLFISFINFILRRGVAKGDRKRSQIFL